MQPALTAEQHSYLVFRLREALYGVPAEIVLEALWLPELTPLAEAPPFVAGLVTVRGQVVPVFDLALLLGLALRPYRLTDSVVLLNVGGEVVGVIVDEVREVTNLSAEAIKPAPTYGAAPGRVAQFVRGVATVGERIIALLEPELLVRQERQVQATTELPALPPDTGEGFFPEATPEERRILRQRALQLRQAPESLDLVGLVPLAVITLGGEYYGLDLSLIREFTTLGDITPVPCCPPHIIGNVNLRGEVLTLIDIRGTLHLPEATTGARDRAVVVEVADLRVGILVDEVLEVIYRRPAEISAIPTALKSGGEEFLKGTTRFRNETLGVLDLAAVLSRDELVVDEEV